MAALQITNQPNDMMKYEHVKYYKTNYRYNSLQKLNESESYFNTDKDKLLFLVIYFW